MSLPMMSRMKLDAASTETLPDEIPAASWLATSRPAGIAPSESFETLFCTVRSMKPTACPVVTLPASMPLASDIAMSYPPCCICSGSPVSASLSSVSSAEPRMADWVERYSALSAAASIAAACSSSAVDASSILSFASSLTAIHSCSDIIPAS